MNNAEITKRAVTYSLLAHINNSKSLAKGQLDIFVPIVKKGLHFLCNQSQQPKGESIKEIADVIDANFGIDIPIPVLRSILKSIAKEINTSDTTLFTLNNDDSFWIHQYIFEDFDELIQQSKRELKNIQTLFDKFCEMNNVKQSFGIVQFIEKNKTSISSYLANNFQSNGSDCTIEAKFVDYFKNTSVEIYNQIRNLYLGAILTSYLDYQPQNAQMNVDLLFDTNFLISLVDLNTEESTKTCNKLLEIGKTLGYSFHALSDTIEEAQSLLRYKAENFNNSIIQKYVNREDIYNACNRHNYNKTDLERIADNLVKTIEKLGIIIIPHTDSYKNKAKFSKEYNTLKSYRNTDKSALHDAMCLIYVQEKRHKFIHKFEDVNCWWVNNAISHDIDNEDISIVLRGNTSGKMPEMIKVDDLLNILWISCPNMSNVDTNTMLDMGLSSLIAYSFNQTLPKARIIKELDENIQKYKNENITDRDVLLLSTRLAEGQIKDIEKINDLAKSDVTAFNERIKEEARKQEKIEQEQSKKLETIVSKFYETIDDLQSHKKKIDESSEKKVQQGIEEGIKNYKTEHSSKIAEKDKEINLIKEELSAEKRTSQNKDDRIAQYELANWKRPKYWLFSVMLLVSIIIFVFYFTAENWDFNYPAKLLNWIDLLTGIRNVLAMGLLCFVHAAFALFSINGIICLCMIKPTDDRKRWLLKLFDKQINK